MPVRVVLASVEAEIDGPGAPVMDWSLPLRMQVLNAPFRETAEFAKNPAAGSSAR